MPGIMAGRRESGKAKIPSRYVVGSASFSVKNHCRLSSRLGGGRIRLGFGCRWIGKWRWLGRVWGQVFPRICGGALVFLLQPCIVGGDRFHVLDLASGPSELPLPPPGLLGVEIEGLFSQSPIPEPGIAIAELLSRPNASCGHVFLRYQDLFDRGDHSTEALLFCRVRSRHLPIVRRSLGQPAGIDPAAEEQADQQDHEHHQPDGQSRSAPLHRGTLERGKSFPVIVPQSDSAAERGSSRTSSNAPRSAGSGAGLAAGRTRPASQRLTSVAATAIQPTLSKLRIV